MLPHGSGFVLLFVEKDVFCFSLSIYMVAFRGVTEHSSGLFIVPVVKKEMNHFYSTSEGFLVVSVACKVRHSQ